MISPGFCFALPQVPPGASGGTESHLGLPFGLNLEQAEAEFMTSREGKAGLRPQEQGNRSEKDSPQQKIPQ